MASTVSILIIDLSAFLLDEGEKRKMKVRETIKEACFKYGLFQVVNHGVPIKVINQAMEQCKEFFDLPYQEKFKLYTDQSDFPYGYHKHKADKNEYLFMLPPGTAANVFPTNPPNIQ